MQMNYSLSYILLLDLTPLTVSAAHDGPTHRMGLLLGWNTSCMAIEVRYWKKPGIRFSGGEIIWR